MSGTRTVIKPQPPGSASSTKQFPQSFQGHLAREAVFVRWVWSTVLCLMPCVLCACHADPRRQAVSAALTQAVRVSCPASLGLGPSAGEGSCNRVGGLRFLGRGERALQFGQGLHLGRRARPSPGPCRPLLPRHMQRLLARLFAKHPSAASARATQGPEALAKLELVLTGRSRRIHRTDRQTMADRQRDRYIRYA